MATVVVLSKLVCSQCGSIARIWRSNGEITVYKAICSCGAPLVEKMVDETYHTKEEPLVLDGEDAAWPESLPEKVYMDDKGTTYRVIVTPYHQFSIRRRAADAIGWSSDPKFQQNYDEYDKAQAALDEKALNKGWRVI